MMVPQRGVVGGQLFSPGVGAGVHPPPQTLQLSAMGEKIRGPVVCKNSSSLFYWTSLLLGNSKVPGSNLGEDASCLKFAVRLSIVRGSCTEAISSWDFVPLCVEETSEQFVGNFVEGLIVADWRYPCCKTLRKTMKHVIQTNQSLDEIWSQGLPSMKHENYPSTRRRGFTQSLQENAGITLTL